MPAPRAPAVHLAFRIPTALSERIDRLARELSTPWHEANRSELARAALERGLDELEKELKARGPVDGE
jgi:predicted DNA-binding protein